MNFYGNVSIKGDILQAGANKHVEIQNYYAAGFDSSSVSKDDTVFALFEKLTREAIEKYPGEWKEILKPYRTAVDAGAIDRCFTREQFNERFGVEVTKTAFSHWMSALQDEYQYKDEENAAMRAQFEALKNKNE